MGWTKITARSKPHRCHRPRTTRRHGDGSTWKCQTCSQVWELHRHQRNTHWNRYGAFCDACGPTRPYMVDGQWYGGFLTKPPTRGKTR